MKNYNVSSAATNNAAVICKTGADLFALTAFNAGVAAAYVKLYAKLGVPNPAADTPLVVLAVPAAGNAFLDLSRAGIRFSPGMGIAIVTGAADTDNTAVAAAQLKVTVGYVGGPNA